MKLSEISAFTIERHKTLRKEEDCLVQLDNELATLCRIFNLCIEWGKYDGQNSATQKKVKRFDVGLTKTRYLTDEEEARLLAQCRKPLKSIVLIGLYTGFRVKSEILTLKPEHIDLPRRTITIEGAYAKNKKTRTLPVHSKLVEVFKNLLIKSRGGYLFTYGDGRRVKGAYMAFRFACDRAKIKGVTPHTLRQTFASRLAMTNVGSVTLQELGRWEKPVMVNRYAHLSPGHLVESIEKIGKNLDTGLPQIGIKIKGMA